MTPEERTRAQLIGELRDSAAGQILRGVVHRVDDSGGRRRVQIECVAGDVESGVEHVQPYGVHAVPREGSECVLLLLGADADSPLVVLVGDQRDRPVGWAAGDSGTYDHRGSYVRHLAGSTEIEGVTDIVVGAGATKAAARVGDDVQASAATDAAMWAWLGAVGAACGAGAPPATLSSVITTGSLTVKVK